MSQYKLFEFRNGNIAMTKGSDRVAVASPFGNGFFVTYRDTTLSKTTVQQFFKQHCRGKITFKY